MAVRERCPQDRPADDRNCFLIGGRNILLDNKEKMSIFFHKKFLPYDFLDGFPVVVQLLRKFFHQALNAARKILNGPGTGI